ncbi:uncharacterized protein LOC143020300 [Oratosquilla oratoria]|uniref:uncharacterized protein LOC143020300 n=1 Tax=Oratosquilla oratoria TaxID=337810 RepID=UPI003F76647F
MPRLKSRSTGQRRRQDKERKKKEISQKTVDDAAKCTTVEKQRLRAKGTLKETKSSRAANRWAKMSKKKTIVCRKLRDQQCSELKKNDVKVDDISSENLKKEENKEDHSSSNNVIYIVEEHSKDTINNNNINNNNNNNKRLSPTASADPLSTNTTWKRKSLTSPAPAQDDMSKKFQCKLCNLWFPTRYFMRKHMFIEHAGQVLECQVCSYVFLDPQKLTNHIIRQHSMKEKEMTHDDTEEDEKSEVPKTPRKIVMEDGVVLGRGSHVKKEYPCSRCDRVLGSRQSLERHERWHTGEKPYQCNVCNYSTSYEEHVHRHMINVHLIVRSDVPCPKYVSKRKKVNADLDSEEEDEEEEYEDEDGDEEKEEEEEEEEEVGDNSKTIRVTSDFPDEYVVNDQSPTNGSSSTSHTKKRRYIKQLRFQCAVCGMRDTHKLHLSKHIRECHPKALVESLVNKDGSKVHIIAQGTKKYKEKPNITCPFCPKVWHDTWKYKMHLRSHTGIKPYGCTECKFVTTTKTTVRDHIERKHSDVPGAKITLKTIDDDGNATEMKIDIPKKEVRCEVCLRVFKSKYDLKFHFSRAHPDVLPFRCKICDLKDNLRANIIIHCVTEHKDEDIDSCIEHKGNPIKIGKVELPTCDLCGKMFPFQSKLNIHMKFHTGKKKFNCNICSYKTNTKQSLENHLIKWHLEGKKPKRSSQRDKDEDMEMKDFLADKRLKQEEGDEEEVVVKEEEWYEGC